MQAGPSGYAPMPAYQQQSPAGFYVPPGGITAGNSAGQVMEPGSFSGVPGMWGGGQIPLPGMYPPYAAAGAGLPPPGHAGPQGFGLPGMPPQAAAGMLPYQMMGDISQQGMAAPPDAGNVGMVEKLRELERLRRNIMQGESIREKIAVLVFEAIPCGTLRCACRNWRLAFDTLDLRALMAWGWRGMGVGQGEQCVVFAVSSLLSTCAYLLVLWWW